MKTTRLVIGCMALLLTTACGGHGERIDIAIPGPLKDKTSATSMNGPRIVVLPFQDARDAQAHLGTRSHLWGGVSYFDLPTGTVSDAGAQAFVEYLSRHGWNATLGRTAGSEGTDVIIHTTIQTLSIDAKSGFMHTDLDAKNALAFQITNRSDESIVRERVAGTGTDRVFWFDPADAQELMSGLFESNFHKFLGDLTIQGKAIRLR
ncbi:MAG: hypothetical protein U0412_09055 [Nitrospira sp.]